MSAADLRQAEFPAQAGSRAKGWWRESELALVLLFVLAAYFSRMAVLPLRGEESRRGLIAREMLQSGDWIVPRVQGIPLYSRPPLQNWLIALLAQWRGEVDVIAVRLPSVCAVLLTSVLIYGYARQWQSRLGALASALSYAAMGQVLELGRSGETDALFSLFVSGALLLWHWGMLRGVSPYLSWCTGYTLAAFGMLTKGPQAPAYFVGATVVYLAVQRQWRSLFSSAHVAGIALFALLVGAWQFPFLERVGAGGTQQMFVSDIGQRFLNFHWGYFGLHLLGYPLELLLCLMPWSGLLIVWCNPRFRRTLEGVRPYLRFLAISLLVTFPTVWLPPGSRPRYYMALYPCLALLVGLAIERIVHARQHEPWRIVWPLFARICAAVVFVVGLVFVLVSTIDFGLWFAQPAWFACALAAASAVTAGILWSAPRQPGESSTRMALLTLAGFVALTYSGAIVNAHRFDSVDTRAETLAARELLPPGTQLVSFNPAHHLFVFYYPDVIPAIEWPRDADDPAGQVPYFCIDAREYETKVLPFRWEPVAQISCDRHKGDHTVQHMVIGHRLDLPDAPRQAHREGPRPAAPLGN